MKHTTPTHRDSSFMDQFQRLLHEAARADGLKEYGHIQIPVTHVYMYHQEGSC